MGIEMNPGLINHDPVSSRHEVRENKAMIIRGEDKTGLFGSKRIHRQLTEERNVKAAGWGVHRLIPGG